MSGDSDTNEYEYVVDFDRTPTWAVALVCIVIVGISLLVERLIHYVGKRLKKKSQKSLFQALQKVKEELMLLGFISLILTVFSNAISDICVDEEVLKHMLPCALQKKTEARIQDNHTHAMKKHWKRLSGFGRRLLSEKRSDSCLKKDKVPLLSQEAIHHLHIFIFVLAIVHVTFCVLTILFGGMKIHQWKQWEDSAVNEGSASQVIESEITSVHNHEFIRARYRGFDKKGNFKSWVESFFKQFCSSVTKSDYLALRLGFIKNHCIGNPRFNFHNYMIRALEDDFRKVVGISCHLWVFVVLYLLLNLNGWHTYFWISFIPLILLLSIGTKLEHVITQLAHEIASRHVAIEGEVVVKPSDDHFWFHRPRILLYLIHFILFQNAFEIAFILWIWFTFGRKSCIMDRTGFVVPRLIIGIFIQVLCSYSTLPLYAIVTQMGSRFKKAIFEEHIQARLLKWADEVKNRASSRGASNSGSNRSASTDGSSTPWLQMADSVRKNHTQAELHPHGTSMMPK